MSAPRLYPALEVSWPAHPGAETVSLLLAALDDLSPTAVEETDLGCRVFFAASGHRDRANDLARTAAPLATIASLEVSDESWAERSQAGLEPVTVDRLTVAPPWSAMPPPSDPTTWITIQPSMGFGTGHHQSTRLCLRLMQRLPIAGVRALDIGTGSGVLAIAAARLGAAVVVAVDYDADAIASARENVDRNGVGTIVSLRTMGVGAGPHADWDEPSLTPGTSASTLPSRAETGTSREPSAADGTEPAARARQSEDRADLVLANLTGAALLRLVSDLRLALAPHGFLVVGGFQHFERNAVAGAFTACGMTVHDEAEEDGWTGLCLRGSEC